MKKKEHPLYACYWNMIRRCNEEQHYNYKNYGGRGIKVCERWMSDFWNFVEDMGEKPSKAHSLDRIDNDGDYSPDNCKWSTRKEQNNNRRNLINITYNGKTQSLSEWSRETGIKIVTLRARLRRNPNISLDDLFSTNNNTKFKSGNYKLTYSKKRDRRIKK